MRTIPPSSFITEVPLVAANAQYYGWRVALYIAGIMFVSIVSTALILNGTFTLLGWVPEGVREIARLSQFAIDYTFWMNVVSVAIVSGQIHLRRQDRRMHERGEHEHRQGDDGTSIKRLLAYGFIAVLLGGLVSFTVTGGV